MSDLETMKSMYERAGIAFGERPYEQTGADEPELIELSVTTDAITDDDVSADSCKWEGGVGFAHGLYFLPETGALVKVGAWE